MGSRREIWEKERSGEEENCGVRIEEEGRRRLGRLGRGKRKKRVVWGLERGGGLFSIYAGLVLVRASYDALAVR